MENHQLRDDSLRLQSLVHGCSPVDTPAGCNTTYSFFQITKQ